MNCKNCKFLGEELFVFSDVIPNGKISSGFCKCDAVKPAYSEGITTAFVMDEEGWLNVTAEFGCVLFDGKTAD
jgi:hypothetical protein